MSDSDSHQQAFHRLDPDTVIEAVESVTGGWCNGQILALNSYENRVYSIGLEEQPTVIAKFYRPERWSDATILEEHQYSLELQAAEVPVVAPLVDQQGQSLHAIGPYRFALYPRVGGHPPELDDRETLTLLGRSLGRLHSIGRHPVFAHRPALNPGTFVSHTVSYLLESESLPSYLRPAYESVMQELQALIEEKWRLSEQLPRIRLHGDLHASNLLFRDGQLNIVDLDDCRNGPAMQDFWMLLGGSHEEQRFRLNALLEGYEVFMDFDPLQEQLIETLRSMRIIHYAGWLAQRRHDPAFVQAFPWFFQDRYWEEHVLALREQLALLMHHS